MKNINKVLSIVLVLSIALSIGCVETPRYITVSTIELDNVGDGSDSIIIHEVSNYEATYTGTDFWGYKTYNVQVWFYRGSIEYTTTYTGINSIDVLRTYEKKI